MENSIPVNDYPREDMPYLYDFIFGNNEESKFNEIDYKIRNAREVAMTDLQKALDIADEALKEIPSFYLNQCVHESLLHIGLRCAYSEQDVYRWFEKRYKSFLGEESYIINKKSEKNNIPDFWVNFLNKETPVECKLNCFDKKALKQLIRYINFYKCNFGIAVANSCSVDIPDNIKFIKFDMEELRLK